MDDIFKYHENATVKVNAEKNRCYYIPCGEKNSFTPLEKWKFAYFDDFDSAAALSATPKTEIAVPSCWQILGYGEIQYTNVRYPFPYTPPKVLGKNPCGVYVTNYRKSASEKHYIVFEGVDCAYWLFVNGAFVGFATVSHNTTEFDLSSFLTREDNEIRVITVKNSSASYLEDQDKFRLSGIFRRAYILGRPADHIRDYKITAAASGELCIAADKDSDYELYDGDKLIAAMKGGSVSAKIENPRLWSDEEPNLYKLVIKCDGETIEEYIGFRTVEIKRGVFTLNGKPVKFRGVNRHSFTVNGYAETEEDMLRDLEMFKRNNINAVRTSHYPPAPEFLRLCDRYGILVLEEADVESHGCGHFGRPNDVAQNPVFEKQFEERIIGMYERDKNRASVLVWSLGNESGWGENFAAAAKKLRKLDTRPLHYENEYEWIDGEKKFLAGDCLDTVSEMYPYISHCEKLLASEICKKKPYVLCEYTHAMGNSVGDIKDYWDVIRANDNFAGAFVWEWCDETVRGDRGLLYGGDHGEKMHDGNFCVDGLVTTERKEKSSLAEVKKIYSPFALGYDGENVIITSRFYYRDFCGKLRLILKRDGAQREEKTVSFAVGAGESVSVPYKTGVTGGYTVLICEVLSAAEEPLVGKDFVYDRTGFTLCDEPIAAKPSGDIKFSLDGNGNISSLSCGASGNILAVGFNASVFRAFIDNERYISEKMIDKGILRTENYITAKNGEKISGIVGAQAFPPILEYSLSYKTENGVLHVKFDYENKSDMPYLPRIGLSFAVKGNQKVTFLGNGRGESYVDKQNYCVKDYYTYNSAEEECPYLMPQEYGSHNRTSYVKLGDCGLCITADREFSFSALPYSAQELNAKKHDFELVKSGNTYIHLDAECSGVGSASCGPVLDDKYKASEKGSIEFKLRFEK